MKLNSKIDNYEFNSISKYFYFCPKFHFEMCFIYSYKKRIVSDLKSVSAEYNIKKKYKIIHLMDDFSNLCSLYESNKYVGNIPLTNFKYVDYEYIKNYLLLK